jgi:hypothetical protein
MKAETSVLLGADLENARNPATGWDAVLAYARPMIRASVVKVHTPRSEGAHHDEVWAELVEMTQSRSSRPGFLRRPPPKEEDLERLREVCGTLYLTAMPTMEGSGRTRPSRN